MSRYRILSMDGGPSGPAYARFLRVIEENRPGFLARADLFAGTSDGATFAGVFGQVPKKDRNLQLINDAIQFNNELFKAMAPSLGGRLVMFTGLTTAFSYRDVLAAFRQKFGTRTLRDLRDIGSHVLIVSFRMKQPWGPKIMHNFGHVADDDLDLPLVDAVFRSGAFPVVIPIRDGYCDGGLFANNPGMTALAQLLCNADHLDDDHTHQNMDDVVMLSMGGDMRQVGGKMDQALYDLKRNLRWGWIKWLLELRHPLLLAELMINAGDSGVSFQCTQFLRDRFWRIALPARTVVQGMTDLIFNQTQDTIGPSEALAEKWSRGEAGQESDHGSHPTLDETLAWVDHYWMDD